MLDHDPGVRSLNATLARADRPDAPLPLRGASTTMRFGRATLGGVMVPRPTVGPYVLTLRAAGLSDVTLPVYVRGGAPALLYIVTEPAPVTDNKHLLVDQPVLGLKDSAGNVVLGEELEVTCALLIPPPPPPPLPP